MRLRAVKGTRGSGCADTAGATEERRERGAPTPAGTGAAGRGRRAGAHPPGRTLSRDTSSSAGRGGRPRPHPRPSRACGSAPRPPPLSLHAQCADGRPGGVWAAPARLSSSTCCRGGSCASLRAPAPGTAAACRVPSVPPPPDSPITRRATARVTAGTAALPPRGPSLGKAELEPSRQLAPRSRWDCAPGPSLAFRPSLHRENPRLHWSARSPKTTAPPRQEVASPRKTAET